MHTVDEKVWLKTKTFHLLFYFSFRLLVRHFSHLILFRFSCPNGVSVEWIFSLSSHVISFSSTIYLHAFYIYYVCVHSLFSYIFFVLLLSVVFIGARRHFTLFRLCFGSFFSIIFFCVSKNLHITIFIYTLATYFRPVSFSILFSLGVFSFSLTHPHRRNTSPNLFAVCM